jgi:hypothetical protein
VSDEFLSSDGMTVEVLKQIFDEAYMETSIDSDGDLVIKDGYRCFLRPDPDGRLLAACSIFGAKEGASPQAKLEYVNRVNDQVKVIRASVMKDGRYFFDYYVPIEGGITKKAVVLAVRRFLSCLSSAMSQDTDNVVS